MNKTNRFLAGIITAVLASTLFMPAQAANAAGITAASAVRSLVASDAWNSSAPRTARAKLSWAKPSSTYGATLVGYKIERSSNKTTWTTAVSNTGSTSTSAYVSGGLKIGSQNYFRVRAITKKGASTKTGTASAIVSKNLTAKPSAPALLGLLRVTAPAEGTRVVRWLPQSASQRGGLTVTYKVFAEAEGSDPITCSTSTKNYCALSGLVAGSVYSLKLTAKNSRGTEANVSEFLATDEEFSRQWYLGTDYGIAATRAWTATRGSSSVVVAVLDSGITKHPEFEKQLVPGFDFVSDLNASLDGNGYDSDPTDPGDYLTDTDVDGPLPSSWHGTHVAGIIAAKQNGSGISGIAPNSKIMPVRVLGKGGSGQTDDLAVAILWAAGFQPSEIENSLNQYRGNRIDLAGVPVNKYPAKVINLSMAGSAPNGCPSRVQVAAELVQRRNVVLVAAAGNGVGPQNTPESNRGVYPTNCDGPISVGSTGQDLDAAYYSNFDVDISAPGGSGLVGGQSGEIYSTYNSGTQLPESSSYEYEQGTSMAAPVVSGIVALMFAVKPDATYSQIVEALQISATPFSSGGICSSSPGRCGSGIANAATALEALIALSD